jgi:catechol 2,3-dioxygenase-like lactoylglutathione lyase family enzyme
MARRSALIYAGAIVAADERTKHLCEARNRSATDSSYRSSMSLFSRIDTVIVRVRDVTRAVQWYTRTLGLPPVYSDPAEGLTVLGMEGTSLTLWQMRPDEGEAEPSGHSFPIFAVTDAVAAHRHLVEHGATVEALQEGPGVRFFTFRDPDGNRLEACQVLA